MPPSEQLADHSRSEARPPGAERPGTQERTTKSTFYCRERVCCHVQRPQQHEGCGFPFHFMSPFPFLWAFPSLCAVDAFFLLQFQAVELCEALHRQNRFAGPRAGARPLQVEMHRTEIALGPLLSCGRKSSWLYSGIARATWATRHRWRTSGYKPFCTNACPPATLVQDTQLRAGWANLPAQACDFA